jgi:hypothetical protein
VPAKSVERTHYKSQCRLRVCVFRDSGPKVTHVYVVVLCRFEFVCTRMLSQSHTFMWWYYVVSNSYAHAHSHTRLCGGIMSFRIRMHTYALTVTHVYVVVLCRFEFVCTRMLSQSHTFMWWYYVVSNSYAHVCSHSNHVIFGFCVERL